MMRWWLKPDLAARRLVKRLHRDQTGNVIVLYVASALLLVAMLWAVIGTGARMVQKETIQSSADAAAFSAAVIKAKGLNIIAFCNLVMAILLAIIMLLRLIKGALLFMVGLTLAACFEIFGGEALCAMNPLADSLYNTYSRIQERVEPRLKDAMKGLAKLERVANKTFPALALVEAYRVGTHSSYQKNFGAGSLVTVAWPLPVGAELSLPTRDGSWNELCDQAAMVFDRVLYAAMTKMGMPQILAGIFSSAVYMLFNPLKGILCGSGGSGGSMPMINQPTAETDCNRCDGATATILTGQKVLAGGGVMGGQQCKVSYYSSSFCGGSVDNLTCNGGDQFKSLNFVSCMVNKQVPSDVNVDMSDSPLPLVLVDDWNLRKYTRAYTMLTNSNVAQRHQSVAVAARTKGKSSAAEELLGTAAAEYYAFNGPGHYDLWHMNWRARLVRFTFSGDPTLSGTGDASSAGGPSAADAQSVLSKVGGFVKDQGAAALADSFLLH